MLHHGMIPTGSARRGLGRRRDMRVCPAVARSQRCSPAATVSHVIAPVRRSRVRREGPTMTIDRVRSAVRTEPVRRLIGSAPSADELRSAIAEGLDALGREPRRRWRSGSTARPRRSVTASAWPEQLAALPEQLAALPEQLPLPALPEQLRCAQAARPDGHPAAAHRARRSGDRPRDRVRDRADGPPCVDDAPRPEREGRDRGPPTAPARSDGTRPTRRVVRPRQGTRRRPTSR